MSGWYNGGDERWVKWRLGVELACIRGEVVERSLARAVLNLPDEITNALEPGDGAGIADGCRTGGG
jgi:hypothetical protein